MPTKTKPAPAAILRDLKLDPLLMGADRAFVETFPRKVLTDAGALPLRRYGGFGLIVTRTETDAKPALGRLQRETDVKLIAVPALNEYGVELFLRYWESGKPAQTTPPIWMPEERRAYLKRLGELASIRGRAHPVGLVTSLILTSPLNNVCPIVVARTDGDAQVLVLGGAGGLRVGLKFPAAWYADVLSRMKLEFGMNGKTQEGRGTEDRGLNNLSAFVLPPLKAETLVLEPRGRR